MDETKAAFARQVGVLFRGYMAELEASHEQALTPLRKIKRAMTAAHRKDRAAQKAWQEQRWEREENARAARLRKGLKGVWDKLTGKYWTYRKANEKEAWQALLRDRAERQALIERQMDQRQALQERFDALRDRHEQERQALMRDLSRMTSLEPNLSSPEHPSGTLRGKFREAGKMPETQPGGGSAPHKDGPDAQPDLEPEI